MPQHDDVSATTKSNHVFVGLKWNLRDDCVCQRPAVLSTSSIQFPHKSGKRGVLPLNSASTVSAVTVRDCKVVTSKSVLWSSFAKSSPKSLFCFRVNNKDSDKPKSRLLGFQTQQEADDWRSAVTALIDRLSEGATSTPNPSASGSGRAASRGIDDAVTPPLTPGGRLHGSHRRHRTRGSSFGTSPSASTIDSECSWSQVSRGMAAGVPAVGVPEAAPDASGRSSGGKAQPVDESLASDAHLTPPSLIKGLSPEPTFAPGSGSGGDACGTPLDARFERLKILHGLVIYRDPGSHPAEPEALMAAQRVHGSPERVLAALLCVTSPEHSCFWAFSDVREARAPAPDAPPCFRATVAPPAGWQAAFLQPRELFLQVETSCDDAGTHTLLFQSVAPEATGWECEAGHVHAVVPAISFSIAPLKPQYRVHAGGGAQQSLVTMVLSWELQGLLTTGSWWQYLVPGWQEMRWAWSESVLLSLVALSQHMDRDSFVDVSDALASGGAAAQVFSDPLSPSASLASSLSSSRMSVAPSLHKPSLSKPSNARISKAGPEPWLPRAYYSSPSARMFKVRGAKYLSDGVKVRSQEAAFSLVGVELMKHPSAVYHIARYLPLVARSAEPFLFVLCFTLPHKDQILHLVLVFAAPEQPRRSDEGDNLSGFEKGLARFLSDPEQRDAKLKLIPSLAEGSWVVRHAVGQKPVMLGKRLKSEYFKADSYFEADIDISANATAANITSIVAGAIKSLVFDIGIVLEGHKPDELPEQLLGTVRLNRLDLAMARTLDTTTSLLPEADDKEPSSPAAAATSGGSP